MNIAKKDKNKMGKQFTILNVWGEIYMQKQPAYKTIQTKKNRI